MKKLLLTLSLLCAGAGCFAIAGCGGTNYQYSFEENGGIDIEDFSKAEGEEFTLPVPVRDGYAFEGWYDNEACTGSPVESLVASESITFYAKWSQLYKITVNLDGGSLSDANELYLKAGANVYDYMKTKIPSKSGLQFGAWFLGENELPANTRMTSSGISLTAKYKVEYSIELWKQDMSSADTYAKNDEETVKGYEYVGADFTAEQELTGFEVVNKSEAITNKTLSATASENVFRIYYDRINCEVIFRPNYPDGTAGEEIRKSVKYGDKVELIDNLTAEGYCLAGWSTSSGGSVDYEVDSIAANLYNGAAPEAKPFEPTRKTTMLFAVWTKGYTNMFGGDSEYGGNDTIFHFNETDTDIYLLRGGVFFKGVYNTDSKRFTFVVNPDLQLIGQLKDDNTYIYSNLSRGEVSRPRYTIDGGLSQTEEIQFDEFNGLKYIVTAENNTTTQSDGVYVVDENGYYVTTFTTGELAGQTLTIRLLTLTSSASSTARYPAFMVRNEEEVAMGAIYRCGIAVNNNSSTGAYEGAYQGYMTSAYQITLDGFGTATMNMGTSNQQYAYSLEYSGDEPVLTFSYSDSYGQRHEMKFYLKKDAIPSSVSASGYGYTYYQEDYDLDITSESGATLTLDGLYNATYHNGDTDFEGYFLINDWSVFGQTAVTLANADKCFTLLIDSNTTEIEGQRVTKYNFVEKPQGYVEYFYRTDSSFGVDLSLMLAYNDVNERYTDAANDIDVTLNSSAYGLDEEGEYVVVSQGVTVYDSIKRVYTYKAYKYFDVTLADSIVDLTDLGELTFTVGTANVGSSLLSIEFNVLYALEAKTRADVAVDDMVTTYTSSEGGTLTLTVGYAVYVENGKRFMGSYAPNNTNPNLLRITDTQLGYAYVVINTEDNTFVSLETTPYNAYALLENGSASETEYLAFDGTATGVTYNDGTNSYVGTFTEANETTAAGFTVYTFASTDGEVTFNFIRPSTSSAIYFAKYNEKYAHTYSLGGVSSLTLDGYSVSANFVDEDGVRYSNAVYMIIEENVAVVLVNNSYRYFDLKDDGTCTMRGTEYGSYRLSVNRYENGIVFVLDGYGKAKVYDMNSNADAQSEADITFIDEDATYTMDGDLVKVVYKADAATTVTEEGKLAMYTYLNRTILIFITVDEDIVRTFVSENDWSVMIMSDIGNVTKYDKYGVSSQGTYRIITDEYFYFSGDSEEGLYKYSLTTGKVNPVSYSDRGFYTSDLKALQFASYGFAAANGTTAYYYYMVGTEVFMYKSDPTNPSANKYGYVRDTQVTAFDDTLTFNGDSYVTNSGFQVVFTRAGDTTKYPVTVSSGSTTRKVYVTDLRFSPAGTEEFSVAGYVTMDGAQYSCTVVRTKVEDSFETYILFSNYLRLYINLTYGGSGNSTYTVTDMKMINEFLNYNYMIGFINAIFAGGEVPLDIGTITLFRQYDENGDITEDYAYSEFNEGCSIVDLNGKVLNFTNAEYSTSSGLTITFTGDDGYQYRLGAQLQSFMNRTAYVISYVARVQTLTDAVSGYSIELARCVFSETAEPGEFLSDYVVKDSEGNELEYYAKGTIGNDLYYIVRTYEDEKKSKILTTTYLKIDLKDKEVIEDGGQEEDDEEEKGPQIIPLYESVTITPSEMDTYYTEDGKTYVDIDNAKKVWIVYMNSRLYVATESSYDEQTQTYTVTLNNGVSYTIKIEGEKAVLTVVE